MMQVIINVFSSLVSTLLVTVFGIGGSVIIIKTPMTHNPRKKWRVLMTISIIAALIVGISTTTYINGLAQYSDTGRALMWICAIFFIWSFIANWVNS